MSNYWKQWSVEKCFHNTLKSFYCIYITTLRKSVFGMILCCKSLRFIFLECVDNSRYNYHIMVDDTYIMKHCKSNITWSKLPWGKMQRDFFAAVVFTLRGICLQITGLRWCSTYGVSTSSSFLNGPGQKLSTCFSWDDSPSSHKCGSSLITLFAVPDMPHIILSTGFNGSLLSLCQMCPRGGPIVTSHW